MSNSVTSLCRPVKLTAPQKSVLMCLADRADDTGAAWPSIPGISDWTCLGRTAVIDSLKALEDLSVVSIEKASGRNNRFQLDLTVIGRMQPVRQTDQSAGRTGAPDEPVREADQSAPRTTTRPPGGPPPVRQTDYTRPPGGPEASISITQAPEKQQESRKRAAAPKVSPQLPDAVLPEWMPTEAWRAYVSMRDELKKPMSISAQETTIRRLGRWRDDDHDVREILEVSVSNGWQGLFAPTHPTPSRAGARSASKAGDIFAGAL